MYAAFGRGCVDGGLVLVEGAVALAGNYQLIIIGEGVEGLQKYVQALVLPYQPEEQQVFPAGLQAQPALRLPAGKLLPEMGIERMEYDLAGQVGGPFAKVVGDGVAEGDASVQAA